jgi:hypothetical protein
MARQEQMTFDRSKYRPNIDFPPDLDPGEAELLIAFDIWIHEKHPNRERIGCPGRERLEAVVRAKTKVEDQYTLDHIGQCAACLDEMLEISRAIKKSRNLT